MTGLESTKLPQPSVEPFWTPSDANARSVKPSNPKVHGIDHGTLRPSDAARSRRRHFLPESSPNGCGWRWRARTSGGVMVPKEPIEGTLAGVVPSLAASVSRRARPDPGFGSGLIQVGGAQRHLDPRPPPTHGQARPIDSANEPDNRTVYLARRPRTSRKNPTRCVGSSSVARTSSFRAHGDESSQLAGPHTPW
jgi:hypothetical protein